MLMVRASSVFLLSYRNIVLNQSVHIFALSYFLINSYYVLRSELILQHGLDQKSYQCQYKGLQQTEKNKNKKIGNDTPLIKLT